MKRTLRIFCLALTACLSACESSDGIFSRLPAYFVMENVLQAPVLYTSVQSMGEFCTIRATGNKYEFASPTQKTPSYVNATQLSSMSGFYMGLSGFIVGLPHIPEMGHDQSRVVCYDLACSNCYHTYNVTKRMTLQEGGYTHCTSCNRTYNLNDMGLITKGEAGNPLIRYRATYAGHTLVINNR